MAHRVTRRVACRVACRVHGSAWGWRGSDTQGGRGVAWRVYKGSQVSVEETCRVTWRVHGGYLGVAWRVYRGV